MQWWVLRRRVHISWIIAIASLCFVIGVASTLYISLNPSLLLAVVVVTALTLPIVVWRRTYYLLPLLVVFAVSFGLWRGTLSQQQLDEYDSYYGRHVVLVGTVLDDVEVNRRGEHTVRLGDIMLDMKSMPGQIWLSSSPRQTIKRSDTVLVAGDLSQGFGNYAGSIYRADIREVLSPRPGDVALGVRDWFTSGVRRAIDEPQASLGIGYVVGQKSALPDELVTSLQIAGLTHVVVASGYNLTILVRLARRSLEKVSKYLSFLAAGLMIVGFIAVTGLSPSMSRAGLVAGLSLLAWYYGRRFHPLVLLPFAAAITVAVQPSYAWNDIGWLLSFAAFGGVMLLAPLMQRYFFGDKKPGIVRQILGETIAAQIATVPIILLSFGVFSNVAVLANLLVVPLVPIAMLLTFIAGIGGLAVPALAHIFGYPAQMLLSYMTSIVHFFASFDWAQVELTFTPWLLAALYVLIIGGALYLWRVTKYNFRESNIVV
ncbi:MAG: rane protein of unknown function [Candidatus Saccharibacteria bacterium]|nr:rane protein of unknown function [Candidatus Saccharibacteria bacterium]